MCSFEYHEKDLESLNVAKKANVVIMCMGITPRLEGEEMRVTVDGFKGGDRTRIDMPDETAGVDKGNLSTRKTGSTCPVER